LSIVFIHKLAIFVDPPTLCFIQARLGKKAWVIQPRKFLLPRSPVLTTLLCPSVTLSKISRLPQEWRQQQSNGLSAVQLCYSKSFPVNFLEFCDLIANRLEGISS
jgi:hypothetical protein